MGRMTINGGFILLDDGIMPKKPPFITIMRD